MTSAQHLSALLATSIATFIIGVFVYFKNKKIHLNQIFALYSLSIATWSLGQGLHSIAPNITICLFWARLSHVGVVFIPTLFLHFVFTLLGILKNKRKILISAYFISSFFLFFNLFTKLYIPAAVPKFSLKYYIEPGFFYPFSVVFFAMCAVYGLYELFKALLRSAGIRHNQLKYLYWSSLFGYIGGGLNFLFVFDICIYPINPFLTYLVPLYVFVVAYAIIRYRLLDINVMITRATVFVFVYILVLGIPFLIAFKLLGKGLWLIPLALMAVMATAGPLIYQYLQRQTEQRLFREKFKTQQILIEATQKILREWNLKRLSGLTIHILTQVLKTDYSSIFLLNRTTNQYELSEQRGKGKKSYQVMLGQDNPLIRIIAKRKIPLVCEELERHYNDTTKLELKEILEQMEFIGSKVIIPCIIDSELVGFIGLGEKRSREMYMPEDLDTLSKLSDQLALTIKYAQFLKEREEIQAKLREADRLKAIYQMMASLNHELNNIFQKISVQSEMLGLGIIKDEEKLKLTANNVVDAVMLGKEVLSCFNQYKAKLKEPDGIFDVKETIETALLAFNERFQKASIKMNLDIPANLPKLQARAIFPLIFTNILYNSYYDLLEEKDPDKRFVFIKATKIENNTKLEITISDTGEDLTKFMDEKRAGYGEGELFPERGKLGGVNIFIIRLIVNEHPGASFSIEPHKDKGTTFRVIFPI